MMGSDQHNPIILHCQFFIIFRKINTPVTIKIIRGYHHERSRTFG